MIIKLKKQNYKILRKNAIVRKKLTKSNKKFENQIENNKNSR